MDAFGVLNEVLGDYENFVKGFLEIKDDQIRSKVEKEIADGLLWPEPWLGLNPAFESGGTVGELVERDVLAPEATQIFRDPTGKEIAFHRHQTDAFEIANRRESYVLTTAPARASRWRTSCRSSTGCCARARARACGPSSSIR
ncbi:hypothetical protein [Candidatus Mycolicibacterium alkanivorans]|uniref:Uncharacterized protein n=1 Tax=Candidatus Mycolicibacterium alkanivorans TaxID=2954114 RepID=A0ABS9YWK2_9MYCO|nr:hypothetical protein [Candidatus Mycolicibacterium alkanivorans]MCI4675627.1 hypothetical protein [Candidatus Mycolicibacterium alkanivorans]